MVESLLGSKPLINLLLNQTLQEFFRLWGVSLEGLVIKMKVAFYHISNDFKLRIAREGNFA